MKKMHYSLIMVFGLAFIAASVCAKDFSFINISWDDSPRDVAKKAKDNGYGAILWISSSDLASGTPMRLQVDSLISASVDSKRNWQLRRYNFYPRSGEESEAVGDIPYVKQLKFYGRRGSIVDEGAFYFSYTTDALLGYKITLNHKSMNNAQINEMLMKKYGKPSKKDKHSKIWKISRL